MSEARQALDLILMRYPNAEVARVFNQHRDVVEALKSDIEIYPFPRQDSGPWTAIDLFDDGVLLKFAIWNATGAVYRCDLTGAVEDDPVIWVEKAQQ